MADILIDEQSVPTTPATGQGVIFSDNAASQLMYRDDSGRVWYGSGGVSSFSTSSQSPAAATDTYIVGSRIVLPTIGFQAGTRYRCRLSASKSTTGTAASVWSVRIGTAGSTADTARTSHTTVAQTAIADVAWFELNVILRNIGASGVLQSTLVTTRNTGVAATGMAAVPVQEVTSGTFDTTWTSGLGIGISVNTGTGALWTITQVQTDLDF